MNSILPTYLSKLASSILAKKQEISFSLKCSCYSTQFILFSNTQTEDEKRHWEKWKKLVEMYNGGMYSDKDGNIFLCSKGFFGIGKKKVKIEKKDIPFKVDVIKAKCAKCGKEYIIFDSRKHGYDAVVYNSIRIEDIEFKKMPIKSNTDKTEVVIKIINDLTYVEFIENAGKDFSEEDYQNAFSNIEIFVNINGKKIKMFEQETA